MNYYHEISNYYDKDAGDFDARYWKNPVIQQIRQSFREKVKKYPAASMLEVGFGTGLDLVHFAKTHPGREMIGIDISLEMVQQSAARIERSKCNNIEIKQGTVEDLASLFPNRKFDLIYVFFGALNTVEDLNTAAKSLSDALNPGGVIVLSFVNKWYVMGMLLELARLRFFRAFARLKPVWGGYSPVNFLPSHCYTPRQVKRAFKGLEPIESSGYTIIHPAWFYTKINRKLGKLKMVLWVLDTLINKTALWRFGEYVLVVFQK